MSSSDDLCAYQNHAGHPIIHKRLLLAAAVEESKVGILQELLDSPKWYNVTGCYGLTLLQIAIRRKNKEVFNYMMSIPDFPIDFANRDGQTALVTALDTSDPRMTQNFAYDLIKKGASINVVCVDGNSPLHSALDRSYDRVAKLLIEKGIDVNVPNSDGLTPLKLALYMWKGVKEVVSALLINGATPVAPIFEHAVHIRSPLLVQEMLFLYVFDESLDVEISLNVILKLADTKSHLFDMLLKYPFRVTVSNSFPIVFFSLFVEF